MKKSLLGLGLFVFISYRIFAPDIFDPYFYDVCSFEYIDKKIEEKFENTAKSKKKQKIIAALSQKMVRAGVPEENVTQTVKAFMRMESLKKSQCPIPKDMERDLFELIGMEEKAGSKNCPVDMFLEKSQAALLDLKKDDVFYKSFETKIYQELIGGIKGTKLQSKFDEKWNDPQFRELIIVKLFQVSDREKNECSDTSLPIRKTLLDFTR